MQGIIKTVMRDRGFGFISSVEGQEVFFDKSELKELDFVKLRKGATVEFEMGQGTKGPRAINVRPPQA